MNPPSPGSGLLPSVVVLDELRDGLVRQHLPDPVKRFSVKLEGLLEQHLVLHAPLVRERSKVGKILKNKTKNKISKDSSLHVITLSKTITDNI